MAAIRSSAHRALDFVTVVAFALAPTLLGLSGFPAWLAYALAVVHLLMTVITAFPGGPRRPVPLPLHGVVELIVGVVLLALPFVLGWTGTPRTFYAAAGGVILLVWLLSGYKEGSAA